MDNQEKIKKLELRLKEIEPILNQTFKTSDELKSHMKKNKNLYEEGKDLFDQIQQLEWEAKTPQEKEYFLKQEEMSKLKREGKL